MRGLQEAKRVEAERLTNNPIRVNVQCDGKPPTQLSVKPHEQVGSSIIITYRELKLIMSEKDQRLKEVWINRRHSLI